MSEKLKLFQLKNSSTGSIYPQAFPNKMEAKAVRRQLNGKNENGQEAIVWIVTPGPDHSKRIK